MRLVFIHVSDFHFSELGQSFEDRAVAIARAARSSLPIGNDVIPLLIVTGDLAFSGKRSQYETVRRFMDALIAAIEHEFRSKPRMFMIPGNHDVDDPWKDSDEYLDWIQASKAEIADAIELELGKSEAYFAFARDYGFDIDPMDGSCASELRLKHDKESISMRVVMLASSPFSSYGNDRGCHHLLEETIRKIYRDGSSASEPDYCTVLVHHPIQYFDDETQQRLKVALGRGAEFVFYGHEHMGSACVLDFDNAGSTIVSNAGQVSRDDWQRSSISCVLFDVTKHMAKTQQFVWDPNEQLYAPSSTTDSAVILSKGTARPRQKFLNVVTRDDAGISESFLEYFEFPDLRLEDPLRDQIITKRSTVLAEEAFFERLKKARIVNIYGPVGSGKSTLLRYLYLKSLDQGFVPLLLDSESATRSFKKSFVTIRLEQYGETDAQKARYMQVPPEKKILLIDDFHRLRMRHGVASYIRESLEQVATVVIATDNPLFQENARQGAQSIVSEELLCYISLGSFTRTKRNQLVAKVCESRGVDVSLWDDISNAIDSSVTSYHTLFPLTPGFIVQYLRYGLSEADALSVLSRCAKPFGEVYKGNLQDALNTSRITRERNIPSAQWLAFAMDSLSFLAFDMHDKRKESIAYADALAFIKDYIDNRDITDLKPVDVLKAFTDADILIMDKQDASISFKRTNQFSFFVAKRIDLMLGDPLRRDEAAWQACLDRLFKEICYGANETILLFLSYLQESSFVPVLLCERVERLLAGVARADDLSFAHQSKPIAMRVVSVEDRMATSRAADESELAWAESLSDGNIEYRGIYDYEVCDDEEDDPSLIPRACKYVEMAVRSYTQQVLTMTKDDKRRVVSTVYDTARSVVGVMAKRYGETFAETVDGAYAELLESSDEFPLSRDDVSTLYSMLLIMIAVSSLDSMVRSMTDDRSIDSMLQYEPHNAIDHIMSLQILSHRVNPTDFCKSAGTSMKYVEKNAGLDDCFAIAYLTFVYVINHPRLSHKFIDKLNSTVFRQTKRNGFGCRLNVQR